MGSAHYRRLADFLDRVLVLRCATVVHDDQWDRLQQRHQHIGSNCSYAAGRRCSRSWVRLLFQHSEDTGRAGTQFWRRHVPAGRIHEPGAG